jgi:acyl-CoA synthetase (AMP-forming)/AMP-acid ligase II
VKTPFLFDGYLGADGEVRLPITPDGFFRTGDLGVLRDGGLLVLKGRSKDIVKKGGYLIILRDLEEAAESHPLVEEAVAVGVPHEFYGESAVLCVRLKPDQALDKALADVRTTVTQALAKFKWPSEIVAVSSFPRTESDKIQRRSLAAWLAAREGRLTSVQVT